VIRRLAAVVVVAALGFGGVTWWALEGGEVGILGTASGRIHVWPVDDETGTTWIEAGNPERPFLRDVAADPTVELVRHGVARRYRAVPVATPAAHDRVRALLRAKYGFADRWINLLVDTSRSVAVRLEPQ
jgi:hypothetical protein